MPFAVSAFDFETEPAKAKAGTAIPRNTKARNVMDFMVGPFPSIDRHTDAEFGGATRRSNFVPVTFGNIVGGAGGVVLAYRFAYLGPRA